MLFEQILLGRPVRGATLPGAEADALTQALAAAHQELGVTMPQIDTRPLARIGMPAINHLWFASVITDPDHFPALHDELYGRKGHALAGRGNLTKERRRALGAVPLGPAQPAESRGDHDQRRGTSDPA
ncbi:MAG: hypothetical protein R3F17_07455 [Planctomycetota bacterium]